MTRTNSAAVIPYFAQENFNFRASFLLPEVSEKLLFSGNKPQSGLQILINGRG